MLSRLFILAIFCCTSAWSAYAQNFVAPDFEQGTILVCKAKKCVQTNHNMSREYLYNQLVALANANNGEYAEVCEGKPETRQCVQKGISFPIQSQAIRSNVTISKARVIDVQSVEGVPGIDLIIDYAVRAGDTFPRCQTSLSRLGTMHAGSADMLSPKFSCRLTETGDTILSVSYHIDYLDFDQGIMGAVYTIDAGNSFAGSGAGYVLFDFAKGVKMDGDETFPYPEQEAALLSGEVDTFDTPADIEAIWMRPTPFLNLLTPTFAPNKCNTFVGGCSAQMLNNPALAVPPAKASIDKLTPPNVASTTGLIEQKASIETILPTERKTVITKKIISEDGKPVYSEAETRYFVRQTPTSEMVEDKSKAKKEVSGTSPADADVVAQNPGRVVISGDGMARVVQNAEKEYAAMKEFAAQTQQVQSGQQGEQYVRNANVKVITPAGVSLTDDERAYIEQLALSQEVNTSNNAVSMPQDTVIAAGGMPQGNIVNNIPVVSANAGYIQPIPTQFAPQQIPNQAIGQPIMQHNPAQADNSVLPQVVKDLKEVDANKEARSFLDKTRDVLEKWLYF